MRRTRRTRTLVPLALCAAIAAVATAAMGGVSLGATKAGSSAASAAASSSASSSSAVSPGALPLGDGKVTTSGPRRGYVYACRTGFIPAGGPHRGGGAQVEGPWIHGETFDLNAKATVGGDVRWTNAKLRERRTKHWLDFSGNGLPTWATTGEFPISPGSDAYAYDHNPNSIRAQRVSYSLPRHPRKAGEPGCLSGGPIGIARNGVAIFDALDAEDRDAVAHEVQDHCGGHPQQFGIYHYHDIPSCLTRGEPKNRASGLVGWALDGYPIFGPRGHGGKLLTDADLDACHGQTSKVFYEGRWQRIYHYSATLEYPYTLGCYHGTPRS